MSELKSGVKILYDMECNIYLMRNALCGLDKKIYALGRKKEFEKPEKNRVSANLGDDISLFLFIGVILAIIINVINILYRVGGNLSSLVVNGFSLIGEILLFALISFVIFIVIGIMVGVIVAYCRKIIDTNKEKIKYRNAYKSYIENRDKDKMRVANEIVERNILLTKRKKLFEKIEESKQLCRTMYIKSGIDKNYWGIITIGYMNEFLRLGISNHLGGTDGLYYLVRKEIKSDKMQFTLDEINNKLDTIINNQSKIYSELIDINRKGNKLIEETIKKAEIESKNHNILKKIECNTALDAYYTEQVNSELRYRNTMDVIFNRWS